MVPITRVLRNDGSEVHVGNRICTTDGIFATVKYIGSVPNTEGIWLGVDWDVDGRGRHNGVKDGVQYFTTRNNKSGSFIRPSKVELGQAFIDVVEERYGKKDDFDAGVKSDDLYVVDDNKRQISVEMVGARKINNRQSRFSQLTEVSVQGLHVYACRGDLSEKNLTNIVELDLSQSLISDWLTVSKITSQLCHLSLLNVSSNRLALPTEPLALLQCFDKLTTVHLNRMSYSWQDILHCSLMFPNITHLYACHNDIGTLDQPSNRHLCTVKMINLEGNKLSNWSEVLKLGTLPNLTELLLSDNGLTSVYFPDVPPNCKTVLFEKLAALFISDNCIAEWQSANELNKLPAMNQMRFSRNPLNTESSDADIRSGMIARIAGLTVYNRTPVDPIERRGAEYDYLKANYTDWKLAGGDIDPSTDKLDPDFHSHHPRLRALIDIHGEPASGELIKPIMTIRSNLISVTISDFDREFKKTLPVQMTVQKLKQLIQKLYQKDMDFGIYNRSHEVADLQYELDYPLRDLSYYSIENNDTILVYWSNRPHRKMKRNMDKRL